MGNTAYMSLVTLQGEASAEPKTDPVDHDVLAECEAEYQVPFYWLGLVPRNRLDAYLERARERWDDDDPDSGAFDVLVPWDEARRAFVDRLPRVTETWPFLAETATPWLERLAAFAAGHDGVWVRIALYEIATMSDVDEYVDGLRTDAAQWDTPNALQDMPMTSLEEAMGEPAESAVEYLGGSVLGGTGDGSDAERAASGPLFPPAPATIDRDRANPLRSARTTWDFSSWRGIAFFVVMAVIVVIIGVHTTVDVFGSFPAAVVVGIVEVGILTALFVALFRDARARRRARSKRHGIIRRG